LLLSTLAQAKVQTQVIEYKIGDDAFEGYLAFDDAVAGKRPGVVVYHDWMGVGPYVKGRCDQLAALGYVAFAGDMYGKGLRPADAKEASQMAGKAKADRKTMRARAAKALEVLRAQPQVDASKVAAMGYCFGGTTSLELARSGADVAGVISFHGGLETPIPAAAGAVKARVLALHGADDPYVPDKEVAAFEAEMRTSGADWQLVKYGGSVHSFTHAGAGTDNSKGAAYNEKADKRSWQAMKDFFTELFGPPAPK